MKFVKQRHLRPSLDDILMAMGKVPRDENQIAFWPKGVWYPCTKFTEIAKVIGSTAKLVKKELLVLNAGSEEEKKKLLRPAGRPIKQQVMSLEEQERLVSPMTMHQQITLSIEQRRQQMVDRTGNHQYKTWELRQLYKSAKVTRKLAVARLGAPALASELVQMQELDILRQQVAHLQRRGYEVLLSDESTFSANSYQRGRHWSLPHQPHQVTRRYVMQPVIAVIGFISARYGKIHFGFHNRSINGA